jgi:hypothetical protein
MDQFIVALFAVSMFASAGAGYFIGIQERTSRRTDDVHSGRNDVEARARRVQ